ncbi:MAG: molybdopterin-dependent oxidoreductase [Nitriliruptorales bacterium]|nr:molybdopterin-dependent oxidoreductase [Nitriliruptorales bacterium]
MPPRAWGAAAGVVGAGVALAVAEMAAGVSTSAASPIVAVGDIVVDNVPPWLKDAAIRVFGQSDKAALIVGTLLAALLVGALIGLLGRRRFRLAAAALAAFGLIGVAAAAGDPRAALVPSAAAVVTGVLAGAAVLWRLLALAGEGVGSGDAGGAAQGRRRFLRLLSSAAVLAAVVGWAGTSLRVRTVASASRARLRPPAPRAPAPSEPAGADLGISDLEPFTTPNETFYRIDTALSVPRVDVETWRLRVTGMVDRPLEWSFDDLVSQGLEEHWVTLCCVSNEVGGRLIGNARWSGVLLRDVLSLAGVRVDATQIVGRSVDGWTAGFPTDVARDGRAALIAVTMNGEPLPIEHGFPARLVVPGLYGYVSATKWLSEIELTTWDAYDAYWIPRGWSKEGPVKTQSRIDAPRPGAVDAGRVSVAGIAWAQRRGIERVEVQVDEGPWNEARLADVPNVDTWRQWVWEWDADPGDHVLQVRATDREGDTQTAEFRPPAPDGATGYHRVGVQVH